MGFLGQVPAKQRAALLDELASYKGAGDTPSDNQKHNVKSVLFKSEAGQENTVRNTNVGANPATRTLLHIGESYCNVLFDHQGFAHANTLLISYGRK